MKEQAESRRNPRRSLTGMAYRRNKEMMLNYDIVPGQRLIFSDLARRLNVSRTPVNNALSILASEGFLDFVPNQGYTVHQITQEEAVWLCELREIIELGAVDRAIEKVTPEKLEILKRQKQIYEKSVIENVSRGRFIFDQEFHACIERRSPITSRLRYSGLLIALRPMELFLTSFPTPSLGFNYGE